MSQYSHRLRKVQEKLFDTKVDALFLSNPLSLSCLSGFSIPEDAKILITKKAFYLFTDLRYPDAPKLHPEFRVKFFRKQGSGILQDVLMRERVKSLGFEKTGLSVHGKERLAKSVKAKLVGTEDLVEKIRMVKDATEIRALRRACELSDQTFSFIKKFLKPDISEIEVARKMDAFMRSRGAEISFDTIVASGKQGSIPHAVPSKKKLKNGELVTLDFGALVDGYHADMTRTIALGKVSPKLLRIHEAVREAQAAGIKTVRPGIKASDVDDAVRKVLRKYKFEKYFTHSTGHGVGLEIHEAPTIAHQSSITLQPGMVFSVEPGVYIPNMGGVRIEDLVLVTKTGHQLLTKSSREL